MFTDIQKEYLASRNTFKNHQKKFEVFRIDYLPLDEVTIGDLRLMPYSTNFIKENYAKQHTDLPAK
jgi:hypothetical protein